MLLFIWTVILKSQYELKRKTLSAKLLKTKNSFPSLQAILLLYMSTVAWSLTIARSRDAGSHIIDTVKRGALVYL